MSRLIVNVEIWDSWDGGSCIHEYTMNHDDPAQRRVLGEQVRNAFEAGQRVVTYPEPPR
jgi:hypothetical protein